MKKHVLLIQGGGEDGYEADIKLKNELQTALGADYVISYPEIKTDETARGYGWPGQIEKAIKQCGEHLIVVAHSLGASLLLQYLSEYQLTKKPIGIFLLAAAFWSGDEDWKQPLKLQVNFAEHLPKHIPMYFYHCRDDEEVPFSHLAIYRQQVPSATFRELDNGGHLFNRQLNQLVKDIETMKT
ncbi:MAG: hypothetical protein EOP46_13125 [Sphingobacteriaceae bacterium]|nr:MAG: hypothetical protein EOP46_13125 [Sphingobacteriaceae bacterium]